MNKDNVFRSSSFYMEEGDVLHLLFRDELGDTFLVTLNAEDDDTDAPEAPTALPASDETATTFVANWYFNENSTGYYLDVAQDSAFTMMIAGYDNLDVGNVNEYTIAGLSQETAYYYRVRAYNDNGTSADSNTIEGETAVGGPLVDLDGNVYTTVTIGTQQWIVENFRCEHYADGTPINNIQQVTDDDYFEPWENYLVGFDTLTVSGLDIISAISDATLARIRCGWIGGPLLVAGNKITISVSGFTLNSGTAPNIEIGDVVAGVLYFGVLADGDLEIAIPSDCSNLWAEIRNGDANLLNPFATNFAANIAITFTNWIDDTEGAMCYYDNDEATNKANYGALYNYYAITNAHGFVYLERDGVQEAGWRVPTVADFYAIDTLTCSNSGKLKDNQTGLWANPNLGATNELGFTALPSGWRLDDGTFEKMGEICYLHNGDSASGWGMSYAQIEFSAGDGNANYGFAVRLVKDL